MKLPVCYYLAATSTPTDVARAFNQFHDTVRTWADGNVGGDNFDVNAFNTDVFSFTTQTRQAPRVISIPALDPDNDAYVRRKGSDGIEIITDPTDVDEGRFCLVAKGTESVQRLSFILEDPAVVAAPGATIKTPTGTMIFEGFAGDSFVFNESSIDVDFRVESNGNANAIFVDAGNDRVGIMNGSPAQPLDVTGNILTSANLLWKSGTAFTATFDHALASSDRTYTFPDAAGTVPVIFSGGSSAILPKYGSTAGTLVDSAVTDTGAVIEIGRATIQRTPAGSSLTILGGTGNPDGGAVTLAGEAGAASAVFSPAGGAATVSGGVGGAGSGVAGGVGGLLTLTGGAGGTGDGANGGVGGGVTITAGQGGVNTNAGSGGAGGDLTLAAGNSAGISGGNGGSVTIRAGTTVLGTAGTIKLLIPAGTEALTIVAAGTEVVVNETGIGTIDFRVESDNDDDILFVDASADSVSLNSGKFKTNATGVGFFGATPQAQTTGWSVTNVTEDKTFDANATTLDEIADVLGTLINTLKTRGDLGA